MQNALFDMAIDHDRIYISSGSDLMVFNSENGALVHQISLPIDPLYHVGGFAHPTLFVDDTLIYLPSPTDSTLLIFDKTTLAQVKAVELPPGVMVGEHQYTHPLTGFHYFHTTSRRWDTPGFASLGVCPRS